MRATEVCAAGLRTRRAGRFWAFGAVSAGPTAGGLTWARSPFSIIRPTWVWISGREFAGPAETAGRAVFDQMIQDWPEVIQAEEEVRAVPPKGLEGDLGELLVDWLQELLYTFETWRLVPLR